MTERTEPAKRLSPTSIIPKPFQIEGALHLATRQYALLADEPGLGKTVQAAHAARMLDLHRILVVCPASVRDEWRWHAQAIHSRGQWDIFSYNQASRGIATHGVYDLLVLDEAHFLKTLGSKRTQAVFNNKTGLARRAVCTWALTGTPVLNRPVELYPVLKALAGARLKPYDSYARFTDRYCGAHFDGCRRDVRGASNVEELSGVLRGFMLRRLKKDVLSELPEKIVKRAPLDLPEDSPVWAEIADAEREIIDRESLLSPTSERYAQLGDLARMRRVVGAAKVRPMMGYLLDLLETVDKVVLFCWHRDVMREYHAALAPLGVTSCIYRGGLTDEQKSLTVEHFKRVPGKAVFVGQIAAAGTGINGLQEVSSDVVFGEVDWTPGVMGQAVDRLHRIGQRHPVNVHLPYLPGTIEGAMLGVNDRKGRVIGKLLGEGVGW